MVNVGVTSLITCTVNKTITVPTQEENSLPVSAPTPQNKPILFLLTSYMCNKHNALLWISRVLLGCHNFGSKGGVAVIFSPFYIFYINCINV